MLLHLENIPSDQRLDGPVGHKHKCHVPAPTRLIPWSTVSNYLSSNPASPLSTQTPLGKLPVPPKSEFAALQRKQ